MARKALSWILEYTSKLPNREEKIKCLRANDTTSLRMILRYTFGNYKWLIPGGIPPYTPCEYPHQENNFYQEVKRLYLFLEGGNNNLTQLKRESMFIELLQSIDPGDARLLLAMKEHKLPYDGFDLGLVQEAFPDLF